MLEHSPLVRAIKRIADYIAEHGDIGLTPALAFKRVFVEWAAEEFRWPGYTAEELYRANKVLNETDFPPLVDIHDLLIALKIGRHRKGKFTLTKSGHELVNRPGKLFGVVTPFFLFEMDRERYGRRSDGLLGNWDLFMNVLNVEAENGMTRLELRTTLYGAPDKENLFDLLASSLYVQVLRPLCWAGLIQETTETGVMRKNAPFLKSPLWREALQLDTDGDVKPLTRH